MKPIIRDGLKLAKCNLNPVFLLRNCPDDVSVWGGSRLRVPAVSQEDGSLPLLPADLRWLVHDRRIPPLNVREKPGETHEPGLRPQNLPGRTSHTSWVPHDGVLHWLIPFRQILLFTAVVSNVGIRTNLNRISSILDCAPVYGRRLKDMLLNWTQRKDNKLLFLNFWMISVIVWCSGLFQCLVFLGFVFVLLLFHLSLSLTLLLNSVSRPRPHLP